jgi:alpha-L-fucosidase
MKRMTRRRFIRLAALAGQGIAAGGLAGGLPRPARAAAQAPIPPPEGALPPLEPMPALPPKRPPGSVPMGDPAAFPEARMDFPIAPGPYLPTWESIAQGYPAGEMAWLREAKFGIWVHFGPQSAGRSGDWYARLIYMQGQRSNTNAIPYDNHVREFGHPSESGYKELLRDWNPVKLDPAALVKAYRGAGARFLTIQGVHHDNFDNWNSSYQPWNSVNLGPRRDLLGEWSRAAREAGMRFGVSFHHEYTWWWWQKAFGSDRTGPRAGVPYDGNLTQADGAGRWWEGLDPRLLYGVDLREYDGFDPDHAPVRGILSGHGDYCRWYAKRWALRIMDAVRKYDPDFIYTDGNSTQPFSGYKTGTGFKCDAIQRVVADYYNRALLTRGRVDTFSIVKFHPGGRGIVNTAEGRWPAGIKTDQPWIGETAFGDWFYSPGTVYDAGALVRYMLECVSRDGCFCVNVPMRPDGSLEEGGLKMLSEAGDWMRVNGEAIYGSRAWIRLGEGAGGAVRESPAGSGLGQRHKDFKFSPQDFRFTEGRDGAVYAFCMCVPDPGAALKIASMGTGAQPAVPAVKSVSLLGSGEPVDWRQSAGGLELKCPARTPLRIALAFKVSFAKG